MSNKQKILLFTVCDRELLIAANKRVNFQANFIETTTSFHWYLEY